MFSHGYYDSILVDPSGVDVNGFKFAGFGDVPYYTGEWNRELDWADLKELVDETFDSNPDILLTHAPPASILDYGINGIEPLLTAFTYREHKIKHHFFGHIHECGGQTAEVMGVKFYNSACTYRIIDL